MFYNADLKASNVVEIPVDADLIGARVNNLYAESLRPVVQRRLREVRHRCRAATSRGDSHSQPDEIDAKVDGESYHVGQIPSAEPETVTCGDEAASDSPSFYITSPGDHWGSDIQWASIDNHAAHEIFTSLFRDLGVADSLRKIGADVAERLLEEYPNGSGEACSRFVDWDAANAESEEVSSSRGIQEPEQSNSFQVYSSFFVARSRCTKPYFHHDFGAGTQGHAFTLITPLCCSCGSQDSADWCNVCCFSSAEGLAKAAEAGKCHLLYKSESPELIQHASEESRSAEQENMVSQYTYRPGKAVVFGHGFSHATQDGSCDDSSKHSNARMVDVIRPFVFLCFTFGSRDPRHWPAIGPYAGAQGRVHWRPCGREFPSLPVVRGEYDAVERRVANAEASAERFWEILHSTMDAVENTTNTSKQASQAKVTKQGLSKLRGILHQLATVLENAQRLTWYFDEAASSIPRLVEDYEKCISYLDQMNTRLKQINSRSNTRHVQARTPPECRYAGRPLQLVYRELQDAHARGVGFVLADGVSSLCFSKRNVKMLLTNPEPTSPSCFLNRFTDVSGVYYCGEDVLHKGAVIEVCTARHLLAEDPLPEEFQRCAFARENSGSSRWSMILGSGSVMSVSENRANVSAVVVERRDLAWESGNYDDVATEFCIFFATQTIYPGVELLLDERKLYRIDNEDHNFGNLSHNDMSQESEGFHVNQGDSVSHIRSKEEEISQNRACLMGSENFVGPSKIGPHAGLGEIVEADPTITFDFLESDPVAIRRHVYGDMDSLSSDGFCSCANLMLGFGCLTNHGGKTLSQDKCESPQSVSLTCFAVNVEGYALHKVGIFTVFRALRDIKTGEELYTDYGDIPTC
eukprot:TRINITY_DN4875_c0_g1_i4.p1 TRINITY_DN4875_c0_g1~~TRINITY_DN4875_c0_g1_i4.p1  ORF type:complete len:864 (-),score=60.06 TRINITY_DN4875_c0_g1_i4:57-2648(-)